MLEGPFSYNFTTICNVLQVERVIASAYHKHELEDCPMYMIHFTSVPTLVSKRLVYLRKGVCYVPERYLVTALCDMFRQKHLERIKDKESMKFNADLFPNFADLLESLVAMQDRTLGRCNVNVLLDVEELDRVRGSFPQCASRMFQQLQERGHLGFYGRHQLMLFFKGTLFIYLINQRFRLG